ncbi:MAG: PQQ-binding-like beta-propeller repeat protein [Chloroflexi bacterium]|nr:PQQ-binding-like beta-propeller repeat protein [Chloroflexota bacterium]
MDEIIRRPKLVVYIIVVVLFFIWTIFGMDYVAMLKNKRALMSRTVENNRSFELVWALDEVIITDNESSTFLIAVPQKLFVYGTFDSFNSRLLQLDPANGELVSDETPGILTLPLTFTDLAHITVDADTLLLGYDGRGKTLPHSTIASGGVAAYDINAGKVRWARKVPGTNRVDSLVAGNGRVSVDSDNNYAYHLFDTATGALLATPEKDFSTRFPTSIALLVVDEDISFVDTAKSPNIEFWRSRFLRVRYPPMILENHILVGIESVAHVKTLDRNTGEVLWQTENNVISNIAVDDSTAFYLSFEAELVGVNIETGQKVASVQFSGGSVHWGARGKGRGFYVAANDGKVFVYLGDSRQLFAFHLVSDE